MKPIRVVIVDDSALVRELFKDCLESDPLITVVATAVDPFDAREKIKQYNPDVITLDIEMPKMDGISFLEKIMSLRPTPVVMASTLTQKGAEATIRCLELGAVDYIAKPSHGGDKDSLALLKKELIRKVKVASSCKISARNNYNSTHTLSPVSKTVADKYLIAIGASTGGVEALKDVLSAMPASSPPIVIVQHMPEMFTASFAKRLDTLSAIHVQEASDNLKIISGNAYIANGGKHFRVLRKGSDLICKVGGTNLVTGHCPSVDVLFDSVVELNHSYVIAVILTGMGKDGAAGMVKLQKTGAYTLGQNQESCVVYGMPKAAMELGGVSQQVSLEKMAQAILNQCK